MADPLLRGRHPYHDCRFIVTAGAEVEIIDQDGTWTFEDPKSALIAKMTDCEQQRRYAYLFAAAPELLEQLVALASSLTDRGIWFPQTVRDVIDKARGPELPAPVPITKRETISPAVEFNEADCGGAFDGRQVTSDADPGL
jgi:hypothetical protein